MREDRPSSTFVISITPFGRDGALDEQALRGHLRRMGTAGVGVYVGGGGSGEGFTLDPTEARRVVEIAVEELRGVVPVRAMGVEPRTADEMVEYVQMATTLGIDACQIYSLDQGHGHRPTGAEIETYFTDVLSAVTVPCVLSTHQSVGYRIPVELLAALATRFEHVIGVNCSHQDMGYLAAIIDAVGDRLTVHVGGSVQAVVNLALGGDGFLSSEANLAPRLCQRVVAGYDVGDLATSLGAFGKVVRLFDVLYAHGGIRVTKAVLDRLGLPGGVPRKPQLPVADATVDAVMEVVDSLDLAAIERW
jgi:4-hydroxy-tetrahydrodipicolinate synthase